MIISPCITCRPIPQDIAMVMEEVMLTKKLEGSKHIRRGKQNLIDIEKRMTGWIRWL